jgi:BirA family biotin operon repressor/biotin-[acetyl-CoA-carboxylase] ligase
VRLRPGDPPAPTLALVAAVALHEVASLYAPGVSIKWPNDLLAIAPAKAGAQSSSATGLRLPPEQEGRPAKLAGILLERADDAVVIGFGVNLAHHPVDLDRPATSIAALAGTAPEPGTFLEGLADAFARWLSRWRSEGLWPIRKGWLAAAHPLGTALTAAGQEGLFDGLDESGALRLRLPDGRLRIVHAGDVFLI